MNIHLTGDAFIDLLLLTLFKLFAIGLAFYGVEKLRPVDRQSSFFNSQFGTEFCFALTNNAFLAPLMTTLFVWVFSDLFKTLIPFQFFKEQLQSLPFALEVLLALLLLDVTIYWRHRISHMWMWSFHAVHHSAPQLTWLTRNRLHPVDLGLAIMFNSFVLHITGFSTEGLFIAAIMMEAVDYWTHSNLDVEFKGPLRYLLVCPYYHRWHHANEREAYNKNYVVMFPFIDILFGTFHFPAGRLPTGYGLSTKEQSTVPNSYAGLLAFPFSRLYRKFRR